MDPTRANVPDDIHSIVDEDLRTAGCEPPGDVYQMARRCSPSTGMYGHQAGRRDAVGARVQVGKLENGIVGNGV
jgi:hypothetical protein